ncbi:MAG: hypothetical protein ACTSR1_00590 [Candidatus Heimdallarchaeota archaeon]
MKDYTHRIACSKKLLDKIKKELKDEFRKHHPEFEGVELPPSFLVEKAVDFYLNS